jgi:hypothetical protein
MLIGVKKRFVFIANSKTASTSIEHSLVGQAEIQRGGGPQRKHIYLRDALPEYDFLFGRDGYGIESFFTFGVMRDPVSWIQSWYRYRCGNKVESPLPAGMSFGEFWALNDWNRTMLQGVPRLQSYFFTDKAGASIVDYIIPYSQLANHFTTICEGLGIKTPLQSKNVSKVKSREIAIAPELAEEMRVFYAEDYALMGNIPQINAVGLAKLKARRQLRRGEWR